MRLIGNFGYPRGIWRQMFDRISKRPSRSRSEDDDDSLTVPTKVSLVGLVQKPCPLAIEIRT